MSAPDLSRATLAVLRAAGRPLSTAEVADELGQPLGLVRTLCGLRSEGLVECTSVQAASRAGGAEVHMLTWELTS